MAAAKKSTPMKKQGGLPPWLTPGFPGAKKEPAKTPAKKKSLARKSTPTLASTTYAIRRNGRTIKTVTGPYATARSWARKSIRKNVPLAQRAVESGGVYFDSAIREFGYTIQRMH